jgi:hypothetical protein
MCGPYEGYLFRGIFMHQLLPDRRRFGFGRISFIALAEEIEMVGEKNDDDDGSKNDSHSVLLSGTHKIISRSHGCHVQRCVDVRQGSLRNHLKSVTRAQGYADLIQRR